MARQNIQSILVSKKDHPKFEDALKHLETIGHNLKTLHKQVDETPNFFRFRQKQPNSKKNNYITQHVGKNDLVIEQPKQKTDERGNTWTPNYEDRGSYTVDTNQPNYHVPNKVIQPRSSIINVKPVSKK